MSASTTASRSRGTQTSAPVASRHRRHRADVVEVRVGEQDAVELDPERVDRAEQLVGLVAGVDDQRAVGAVAAEQVAVLLHRPDGEHAHVHGPEATCFAAACCAGGSCRCARSVVVARAGCRARASTRPGPTPGRRPPEEQHHEHAEHAPRRSPARLTAPLQVGGSVSRSSRRWRGDLLGVLAAVPPARPVRPARSIVPAAVPRCFRVRLRLVWAIVSASVTERYERLLDHVPLGGEAAQRHVVGEALERGARGQAHQLGLGHLGLRRARASTISRSGAARWSWTLVDTCARPRSAR